ncbi:spider silk-constituting element SpiCE-NMa5 [Trichonephila inaurata madagascariensis]|uniref:Spider silk-constituting element SpiCE-NMa5 n=1 Tax=Trichonephila inaurata madagascariensis TaxID=2747483 RepID=A0A8X6IYS3_9ARAC|nr:spider silk-constituting element SpiCE-NMa5 [Trichonephila inaurata madagascariensis]
MLSELFIQLHNVRNLRYKIQREIIQSKRTIATMISTTRYVLALLGVLCILNSFVLGRSVPASMTADQSNDNPSFKEAIKEEFEATEYLFDAFESTILNEIRSLINMMAVSGA